MEIKETEHYTELKASDNQGDYSIQIQNDGSQFRLNSEGGWTQTFIDTDKRELTAIRDLIDKVISKL